ncbi:MAG: nucleoside phosphorylase [Syntrophobacteria bacterium]
MVIASRASGREKTSAPVAIMACDEADLRRLATSSSSGTREKAYNARILDVIHSGRTITVAGPVLGAPQAVLVLERLIAQGSRAIVVFGRCGSLQQEVKIGDWVLPSGARSEEGTSLHYPPVAGEFLPHPVLAARLREYCEREDHPVHIGPVWTTDAPLRETAAKVHTYGQEGILGVEMEMSALFRVAAYRMVPLAGLLVVSDELFTLQWRPGFRSTRFKKACRQGAGLILEFCAGLPKKL